MTPEQRRVFNIGFDAGWQAHEAFASTTDDARESKPEVFEHYPAPSRRDLTDGDGEPLVLALCDKLWTPGADVTVVGRCPDCTALIESGWVA